MKEKILEENPFAVIVPMANEEDSFEKFIDALKKSIGNFKNIIVYLITDNASEDNTPILCKQLSTVDVRFVHIHEPVNKNVVDAYLRGYREAIKNKHAFIIEMDAGSSHNSEQLIQFANKLLEGYDCVLGSRYIKGGMITNSSLKRKFLSKTGTLLSNLLLGTKLTDMTSGYQGFSLETATAFVNYPFKSTAHFYQTELRYLLRNKNYIEVAITYQSPSPSVSTKAVINALHVLWYYFICRITGNAKSIK